MTTSEKNIMLNIIGKKFIFKDKTYIAGAIKTSFQKTSIFTDTKTLVLLPHQLEEIVILDEIILDKKKLDELELILKLNTIHKTKKVYGDVSPDDKRKRKSNIFTDEMNEFILESKGKFSVKEIAQKLDVKQITLYYHFTNILRLDIKDYKMKVRRMKKTKPKTKPTPQS